MSDNINLREIIASFGETELNANTHFKKYKEHCPYDPYGVILKRTYRARLSDIVSNLEGNTQFNDDIYVLVELSLMKENSGRLYICISAFPYVSFGDTDNPVYCGGKEDPAAIMTENANEAEEYLEKVLTSENVLKAVSKVLEQSE